MVENGGRIPLHIGGNRHVGESGHVGGSGHIGNHWWGSLADPLRILAAKVADFFAPAAEASRTKNHYDIRIELPGVAEDDISVHLENSTLIVSGEKRFERSQEGRDFFFSEFSYGKFQRSFHLPEDAEQDTIKATYIDGVLNITVGKRETGKTGKRILIDKP